MKRIFFILTILIVCTSCSDFLDNEPKGTWHSGNYDDGGEGQSLLVLSKLFDGYNVYRDQTWPITAMHCHTTDNSHPGGPAGDGGVDFGQFPTLTFTPANGHFSSYYSSNFTAITAANEALRMIEEGEGSDDANQLKAEAYFIRAVAYFRLCQAFGAVPYVDRVMDKDEEIADQISVTEIHSKYLPDLIWAIDYLPTRQDMVSSGNLGRATQNAARAIIAKTYLYDKDYANCLAYTTQIIESGDNDLNTPYNEMFWENREYSSESVWEINADYKPDLNIDMWSQWNMMNGIRGFPNLGWGHNAPSQDLLNAYETGDPRYSATVLEDGEVIDGEVIAASNYTYFNKKAYCPLSERSLYGRADWCFGYWANLRIIRYADIVLMHAEAACEQGDLTDARKKLEMIRARARKGLSVLPEITTNNQNELREKIRQERRIELALEFERYFDLVRWGIAKDKLPNFVVGKHELFPLPQTEIDKANGKLKQNPGY